MTIPCASEWLRINWPDERPMPTPGCEFAFTQLVARGRAVERRARLLDVRMDFEPGWIQIEIPAGPAHAEAAGAR
jgi:hypothetical protein